MIKTMSMKKYLCSPLLGLLVVVSSLAVITSLKAQ